MAAANFMMMTMIMDGVKKEIGSRGRKKSKRKVEEETRS